MTGDSTAHHDGQRMLDLFASVGATHFDVTWTTCAGDKELFRRNVPFTELERQLPAMLDHAPAKQRNIIVRPHGAGVTFIQLDDLEVRSVSLPSPPQRFSRSKPRPAIIRPGSPCPATRTRILRGGSARASAPMRPPSGATRVAGSLNFKDKYAPSFPRVAIHAALPGRFASPAELERLGLVAAPEPVAQPLRIHAPRISGNRSWPSYTRCLDGAPLNSEETGPDVSRGRFCLLHDRDHLGLEHRRHRRALDGRKRQSAGQR